MCWGKEGFAPADAPRCSGIGQEGTKSALTGLFRCVANAEKPAAQIESRKRFTSIGGL